MKVNRKQLADIFGIALTTVDSWRNQGCPVEREGGKGVAMVFDTREVFQWIMDISPENSGDYSLLLDYEKYREKKRENDLSEGLVAPISLLTDALEKTGNIIIPILESLPLILKRRWPEITGDQVQLVKASIAECRNTIADINLDGSFPDPNKE